MSKGLKIGGWGGRGGVRETAWNSQYKDPIACKKEIEIPHNRNIWHGNPEFQGSRI